MLWFSLYLLLAGACLLGWYLWAVRRNRSRAAQIVRWIEAALDNHGHVVGLRWVSPSHFEVPVRLGHRFFHHPVLKVRIAPLELPVKWLSNWWRGVPTETVTFQADLDLRPAFNMELQSLRWFARSRNDLNPAGSGWHFETTTPVVLTTRMDWQKEITGVIQSVLSCEQREMVEVVFRRSSPHFTATLPLDAMQPGSPAHMAIFPALRTIASGASAKAS